MNHVTSQMKYINNLPDDRITQSNQILSMFEQALIIPLSEGVAWLPSLHLNYPYHAFQYK